MLCFVKRSSLNAVLSAILIVLVSLPATSFAGKGSPTAALDYGLDLFDDDRYKNAEKALLELLGSTGFRRLDTSQRSLVYAHIAYSKINRGKERESLKYIDKALAETKREFGKRSMQYVGHLRTKALALYWADDRRKAVRVGESMLDILERMDGDYRDEQYRVRHMVADMRKINLEEGELPDDLSDFYTACESINSAQYLAKVDSIMNDYELIGRDFKPDYKQSRYFKNTYIKSARESSSDRRNRIIYIPDEDHLDDWCVIYPDDLLVDRVIISASDDH